MPSSLRRLFRWPKLSSRVLGRRGIGGRAGGAGASGSRWRWDRSRRRCCPSASSSRVGVGRPVRCRHGDTASGRGVARRGFLRCITGNGGGCLSVFSGVSASRRRNHRRWRRSWRRRGGGQCAAGSGPTSWGRRPDRWRADSGTMHNRAGRAAGYRVDREKLASHEAEVGLGAVLPAPSFAMVAII
jgi:hypothetical protein